MKKLQMVKSAGSIIIATGVSTIVSCIVKDATSEETGSIKKLCVFFGGVVISSMVAEKAVNFFEEKVDSAVSGAKELVEEVQAEMV